jgi:electron transfer flavoprotein beta subunit
LNPEPIKIYVCVKHVPDTAARISVIGGNQINEQITFIINPYDENAVEEAARLKRQVGNAEIIAVTLGKKDAVNTLRSALAMGADRGIHIRTDQQPDGIMTARALKAAIESDGNPDIIFTGKESIDSEGFQTMCRLAAAFDMPVATNVSSFSLQSPGVVVECEMEAGAREIIEMPLPCVVSAGKGLNQPSYPTLPAIMQARKKEIKAIDLHQLGIAKPEGRVEILDLNPSVEGRSPKALQGDATTVAREIVRILHEEAKVI